MNAKLLRAVLSQVEDYPEQFDTGIYGEPGHRTGPVADLAGWTLLLSGWELIGDDWFREPEGGREVRGWQEVEGEAAGLLGLTEDHLWGNGDCDTLFALSEDEAVKRLRELTKQAEAAVANA